jgi:hypothetical protein
VIGARHGFADAPDAFRTLEAGTAFGNICIDDSPG